MAGRAGRRASGAGAVRQISSGRWQASIMVDGVRVNAPTTFDGKGAAESWLSRVRRGATPMPPIPEKAKTIMPTVSVYAERVVERRRLKPRTVALYRSAVRNHIKPSPLGDVPLDKVTPTIVSDWFHTYMGAKNIPTGRAHAYALLGSVMTEAVEEELITRNPCRIRGGTAPPERKRNVEPLTYTQLLAVADGVPAPYRAAVLLGAAGAMRFGELAGMKVADVDLETGYVHIRRAVVRVDGVQVIGDPKTKRSKRSVTLPGWAVDAVRAHIADGHHNDMWLFPAAGDPTRPMTDGAFGKVIRTAGRNAGITLLTSHRLLRHTGMSLAGLAGADLAVLMQRSGHTRTDTALRYMHATDDLQKAVAARMGEV